jgi:ribosomal protein S18 acetylase RimI-like enzyme
MQTELQTNYIDGSLSLPQAGRQRTFQVLCGKNCDAAQMLNLARELLPLYLSGFLHENAANGELVSYLEDLYRHLSQAERIVICRTEQRASALVVSRVLKHGQETVFHLQGIIVAPELQGTGFAPGLLRSELQAARAGILAFHTQSAIMLGLAKKVAEIDAELSVELATAIGTRAQEAVIDRRRYGGQALYGDAQRFALFALRGLDVHQGDALICAARVRKEVYGG